MVRFIIDWSKDDGMTIDLIELEKNGEWGDCIAHAGMPSSVGDQFVREINQIEKKNMSRAEALKIWKKHVPSSFYHMENP